MLIQAKKSREDYFESRASCSDIETRQKEWKHLWGMQLPSKIKVFCWRLALNSVPTGKVLKSGNLATTAECKICGAGEDSWEHALLHCTMSRCVWALVDEEITELLATLRISDPKHWVLFMCCNIPQVEAIKILVTCWAIWHDRRKAIHEGVFQSPLSIMAKVNQLIQELETINGIKPEGMKKFQTKQKSQRWLAPEQGLYKINTDAAVDRVGSKGAIAAVCRGNQGEFIAASAMVIPNIIEPETLEVMACLEALALAQDCAIRRIKVASDCLGVVKNIMEMNRCAYMMILQDIHQRSKTFDCVRFAHEGRDFNKEAYYLAKHACQFGAGRHVWLGSPPVFMDVNVLH